MKLLGNVKALKRTNKIIRANKSELDFCNLIPREKLTSDFASMTSLLEAQGYTDYFQSSEWLGIWANNKSVMPHTDDANSKHTVVWFTQCTGLAWLMSTGYKVKCHSEIVVQEGDVWVFDSTNVHALIVKSGNWTLLVNDVKKVRKNAKDKNVSGC